MSSLLTSNVVVAARVAAKNQSQALDEKTGRTHKLHLMALEKFAAENRDNAVLFAENNKRPFLATTVQTFMPTGSVPLLILILFLSLVLCCRITTGNTRGAQPAFHTV